jgi:hypothetical protein
VDGLEVFEGAFHVWGWTADRGYCDVKRRSHRITDVDVLVNGRGEGRATIGDDRPDVAEHLGVPDDPLFRASGWQATVSFTGLRRRDVVLVVATCEHGATFVLDSTRVGDIMDRTVALHRGRRLHDHLAAVGQLARDGGPRAVASRSLAVLGSSTRRLASRVVQSVASRLKLRRS